MDELEKNTMLIFNNDINSMSSRGLTSKELNVLMTVFLVARDRGLDEIKIPVSELRDVADVKGMSNSDFCDDMENFDTKVNSLKYKNSSTGEYARISIFSSFYASKEEMCIRIGINPYATYLFNNLNGNFTRMNLRTHNKLSLRASKILYRNLCQYQNTGYWKVTIADFLRIFGISESYEIYNIKSKIINPAIRELSGVMKIVCNPIKNKRGKAHETLGFEFLFKIIKSSDDNNAAYCNEIIPNERTPEEIAAYEHFKGVVRGKINGIITLNDMQVNLISNKAREAGMTDEQLQDCFDKIFEMKDVHNFMAVMLDIIKNPKKYENTVGYKKKRKKQEWERNWSQEEMDDLEQALLNKSRVTEGKYGDD